MPSMPELMAELLNGKDALIAAQALADTGNKLPLETMLSDASPWGGYITVVYAIMNFLSAPVLGGLSDRFGRRPILLISIGTAGDRLRDHGICAFDLAAGPRARAVGDFGRDAFDGGGLHRGRD